jgi:FlaA1/EpsC-like NDP-sugar epimerase
LRPGEKLYEELLIGDNPQPTQHTRIMKAHEKFLSWPQLDEQLRALSLAISVNDVPIIRGLLKLLVNDYQPSGEVVDWVYLAHQNEAMADNS